MSKNMPILRFQRTPGIAGVAALLCLTGIAAAQRPNHPPAVNSPNAVSTASTTAQFGSPLPGLSATDLVTFATGQAQFEVFDTAADGLGPIFNAQACVACHSQPITSTTPTITPPFGSNPAVVSGITSTKWASPTVSSPQTWPRTVTKQSSWPLNQPG